MLFGRASGEMDYQLLGQWGRSPGAVMGSVEIVVKGGMFMVFMMLNRR